MDNHHLESIEQWPYCAGCGSHFRPADQHDVACPECTKWKNETPPKVYATLTPGLRQNRPELWRARWEAYWA